MMRIVWWWRLHIEKFKINGVQGLNRLFGEFTKRKVLIDVKGLYKREDLEASNLNWWRL